MAQLTMTEILNNIGILFDILIPGTLCVWCYTKFSMKKIEAQAYWALSISIGLVIKYVVDLIDSKFWWIALKGFPITVAYAFVGLASAFLYYEIKNHVKVRKFVAKFFGIDSGDNLWTRFLDPRGTGILLHLDDGMYILGTIRTVDDEFVTLVNYCIADTPDGESMDEAAAHPLTRTVMCVPMSYVKKFEFLYKDHETEHVKFSLNI